MQFWFAKVKKWQYLKKSNCLLQKEKQTKKTKQTNKTKQKQKQKNKKKKNTTESILGFCTPLKAESIYGTGESILLKFTTKKENLRHAFCIRHPR